MRAPEEYDLDRTDFVELGSFAQLIVDGVIVGYIILGDNPDLGPKNFQSKAPVELMTRQEVGDYLKSTLLHYGIGQRRVG